MSLTRLIIASLLYHRRTNLAVALGIAAAATVLSGALLVGDSMRGSLRHLVLDRLGKVDRMLLTDSFFREELAEEMKAVPVVMLGVSMDNTVVKPPAMANRVQLIGCDERFWKLGHGRPKQLPENRQVVLNEPLALRLGATTGDRIMVRLPQTGTIPAESALGKRDETVGGFALTVSEVIPAAGLGRFAAGSSQQLPLNAYVPLEWLQSRLDRPARINAMLATADSLPDGRLRPRLEDYGISLRKTERGYFDISSQRMLFGPAVEKAILKALDHNQVQPALTYLANTIACGDRQIPYSTITAIDFTEEKPLGPFLSTDGRPVEPLANDQIVLNSWAAEQLAAKVGDTIRLTYFDPASTHGKLEERTVELKLTAVLQLKGAAADRNLTPRVEGITDELSMADWDPPFPFDAKRIRADDEKYWDDFGATPKAMVSLATGRRLWASRFGQTTSIRVQPTDGMTSETLAGQLQLDPAEMGFIVQPIKKQGLRAAAGTTPFNVLFLCFSFFLIASAVMLISLLFRLGIDRRAKQIGILTAVGLKHRQIVRLLAVEGLLVAALGSLLGVAAGVGYAALMLAGLRTWWLGAVVTPFLRLYITPTSMAVGWLGGLLVALSTILFSVRRVGRISPRRLLAGETGEEGLLLIGLKTVRPRYFRTVELAIVVMAHAVAVALFWMRLSETVRAGAFFGMGAVVLTLLIVRTWIGLRARASKSAIRVGRGNMLRMAASNAARNPGRSTLTIALVASATFLIVAISAFHLDPSTAVPTLDSGNGGFALVAQSDRPIYQDPGTPDGRAELGFDKEDSRLLEQTKTISLRVKPGDDASCLNLYRAVRPRLLGVPKSFVQRAGFAWADSDGSRENPWKLLERPVETADDGTPIVPVVLEKNTANYALNLWKGIGQIYEIKDDGGRPIRLRVVGLLSGSIFQGDLLVSEENLLHFFRDVSGHGMLLVETPPEKTAQVAATLRHALGDYGLDVETSGARLARFLAVQNTYLSTFQSLGGLGLLLGTIALAAVQLRAVFERRGELALIRASGFTRRRVALLVILENGLLLLAGLACGILAALLAVLPHILSRTATIPWTSLAATLALVMATGLIASLAAVRAAMNTPLLETLREES